MVVRNEKPAYPLSEVMDIERSNLLDRNKFKNNLKIGVYKELRAKGLITEEEFKKLVFSLRTFDVGHAIMQ